MDPLPAQITIHDKYAPAMTITNQAVADAYFARLVEHHLSFGRSTRAEAEQIERTNLGYFAGYYDAATRERVERLFRCAHPFFGAIAEHGQPSPEAVFAMGKAVGERVKKGSGPINQHVQPVKQR